MIFDNERLVLSPHPKAPTFSKERDPRLLLKQLTDELTSQNFQVNDKIMGLLREAGFVSLWFYLKYILGFAGPYDKLDRKLHLSMCNFRQRVATEPGIKAGLFVPRSCFKSTIGSHGGNTWELLRNPDLRIGCTSSIFDRAFSFVQTTIANFTDNPLHRALYPEYKKANRDTNELVLENRTKKFVEPSLKPITAGGSTQGIHVDLFDADDIVGDDMLNSERAATADMIKMVNWFHTNMRTLVVDWNSSRVLDIGTRYSPDDPHEIVMANSREQLGYWEGSEYDPVLDGEWVTFYVPAVVNGESINPAAFTVAQLQKIAETDPWTYQSQYMNNANASAVSDFAAYAVHDCEMEWSDSDETYKIIFDGESVLLNECDVVSAGDPAGSEKRTGTRTSRGSACVIARDAKDRIFVLEAEAGFVSPMKWFDWLFSFKKKYGVAQRSTIVEAQGGFKALAKLLQHEQEVRHAYLNLLAIPALGNKETTIRNILQPSLNRGKLYVRKSIRGKVMEELRSFPSSRMDLLDAIKIGIFKTTKPQLEGDEDEDDEEEGPTKLSSWRRRHVSKVTGY